jgi:hypothetical protein
MTLGGILTSIFGGSTTAAANTNGNTTNQGAAPPPPEPTPVDAPATIPDFSEAAMAGGSTTSAPPAPAESARPTVVSTHDEPPEVVAAWEANEPADEVLDEDSLRAHALETQHRLRLAALVDDMAEPPSADESTLDQAPEAA